MKYDMNLFKQLNEEYKDKPVMKSFPIYEHKTQLGYAQKRLENLEKLTSIRGKRILEIGCGGGYVSRQLVEYYDCDVIGIDVYESPVWSELGKIDDLDYRVVDLSKENPFDFQSFDLIISYVVWEHIKNPFKVLKECSKLIKSTGKIYIYANQYRSAIASHVYRDVFFPYPHLLFSDDIVIEYCLSKGVSQEWIDTFYYVNKLSYSHYKEYFKILNLKILDEKFSKRKLDFEFYERFEEKLGLYPIFDLELDFFGVLLEKDDSNQMVANNNRILSSSIKSDKKSPQKIGTKIKWSILANGNDLEFAWYIYKESTRIETIWYSKSNELDWSFIEAGEYKVKVFVKDGFGNKISEWSEVFIIES